MPLLNYSNKQSMAKRNAYNTLLPYILYLQVLHILPFSTNFVGPDVSITVNYCVLALKMIVMNAWFYIGATSVLESRGFQGSGIIQTTMGRWLVIATAIFTNVLIIASLGNRKTFAQALNKLLSLERQIHKLGVDLEQTKQKRIIVAITILCTIRSGILQVVVWNTYDGNFYSYILIISYCAFMYFDTFLTYSYAIPMMVAKKRLMSLNCHLQNCDKTVKLQKKVKAIHNGLCNVVQLLHKCFQLNVLLRITTLFLTLNYSSFFIYKTVMKQHEESVGVVRSFYFMFDFSEVAVLSYIGESMLKEVIPGALTS